jgi:hypothetical protein
MKRRLALIGEEKFHSRAGLTAVLCSEIGYLRLFNTRVFYPPIAFSFSEGVSTYCFRGIIKGPAESIEL